MDYLFIYLVIQFHQFSIFSQIYHVQLLLDFELGNNINAIVF